MYIYKITNDINDKVYIGQTINPVEQRFKRHISSAINNQLDTHFARAIRKIGPEHFSVEIIDTATNQEELTEKEYYWICHYDAVNKGYNETSNKLKCGGNTYMSKTKEELEVIKEKIRKTKLGGNNPHARKVKCRNIFTGEIFHFNSLSEMQTFFDEKEHTALGKRCNGKIKSFYKDIWQINYEEDDFCSITDKKYQNQQSKRVQIIDLNTKEIKVFKSCALVERTYGLTRGKISKIKLKKGNHFILNNLDITILD